VAIQKRWVEGGVTGSGGGVENSTIRVGGVRVSASSHTESAVEYKVAYTGNVVPAGAVQVGSLATLHPRLGIAMWQSHNPTRI
jgi:hypothetical protein